MELIGQKIIRLQDAKFKVVKNNSNEASIFLSNPLFTALEIDGHENASFMIEKEDVLKLLCFAYSFDKPLYIKQEHVTLDEKWFNRQLSLINKQYDTQGDKYTFTLVRQTQGRSYFKAIEQQSGFNLRDLFIQDHVSLMFYKSHKDNLIRISLSPHGFENTDDNDDQELQKQAALEASELRKFALESFKYLHKIYGDQFLKDHASVNERRFNDVEVFRTYLFNEFFSDRLLAAFNSERDEENLKDRTGRIRYFLENLRILDEQFIYFSTEWSYNGSSNLRFDQLVKFIEAYSNGDYSAIGDGGRSPYQLINKTNEITDVSFRYDVFFESITSAGLRLSRSLVIRFIASLLTKPFVLLTGLSGSGKTKLAQSFVQWVCESKNQYRIIPVGADWTNREPLLGYPNGLILEEYILPDSGALQILFESNKQENAQKPYFLILDEMNLSHVERYFADFLSVMESHKRIKLYDGIDRAANKVTIDREIAWPKNLFIIGTVNVDETTYMFSPKVLDRANVIEFRVVEDEMKEFLENVPELDMKKLHAGENENNPGLGADMAADFLSLAENRAGSKIAVSSLNDFFPVLQKAGAEFGYRTASEINRLAGILETIAEGFSKSDGSDLTEKDFIDIAVMQKLLPKLHGSRNRLVPVLVALGRLCLDGIDEKYSAEKDKDGKQFISEFFEKEVSGDTILYKLSFDKIKRMYKNLIANGFTSYAEA